MDESLAETASKPDEPLVKHSKEFISSKEFVTLKTPYSEEASSVGNASEENFDLGKINFDQQGSLTQNVKMISLEMEHMKRYALARCIQEDPKATDLKWSMFCAACQSYRYDSVLKPFPPFFFTDSGHKDIDRLV